MTTGDSPGGYGKVWKDGKTALAHRVVYEALVGPIPDGMTIDHLCRIKRCVRPDHMEPVTGTENMARTRKDFCKRGHRISDNEQRQNRNSRRCGICHAERERAYRARRRGQ